MAAGNGAIGDRGLHSENSRIGQVDNGTRKIRQSLALKKAKLVAIVIVVLLVGVFAVAYWLLCHKRNSAYSERSIG